MIIFISLLAGTISCWGVWFFLLGQQRHYYENHLQQVLGKRHSVGASRWLARTWNSSLLGAAVGIGLVMVSGLGGWTEYLLTGGLGFFLAWLIHYEKTKSARRALSKDIPFFLDLFSMAILSGLNFENALSSAVRFLSAGPLQIKLSGAVKTLKLGQPVEEVFDDFSKSMAQVEGSEAFTLIKQALKWGSPLGNLLTEYADSLREKELLSLEKRAQTAGLRLLFPIMIFIFPTLFIVLFGSLILQVMQTGSFF